MRAVRADIDRMKQIKIVLLDDNKKFQEAINQRLEEYGKESASIKESIKQFQSSLDQAKADMIKELEKTYKKDEIDVVIQRFVQAAFDMQNERLLGDRKAMHSQIYEVASIASNSFITETNYLEMKKEIDNKLQRFPAYKHIFGQIQKFLIDDVGIDNVIQLKKIDEKNLSDFIINKYKDENIYISHESIF